MTKRESASTVPNCLRSLTHLVLVSTIITIPLVLSPHGQDAFRFPKELIARFSAIVLLLIAALAACWSRHPIASLRLPRLPIVLTAIILLWSGIVSLTSTNIPLSLPSMLWVGTCAIFFLATYFTAKGRTLVAIEWIAIPTAITFAIYALQEFDIWRPFGLGPQSGYHGSGGLLGTPDDVAMFLVPATLSLAALSRSTTQRADLHLVIAVASAITVVWTQTLTAIAALFLGGMAGALLTWPRSARRAIALILIAGVVFAFAYAPVRHRITGAVAAARAGDYDRMLAGRALPWAAAWEMIKARPLLGVGPGCYSWQYFPFRREAEAAHPALLASKLRHSNFGQAHSDHLQLAATAGIPGYALFLAVLWRLGLFSRCQGNTPEARFSQLLAAPLAGSMFVMSIAQFPLELAAPTILSLYVVGLLSRWSE